jgi:hypothetical protein
MGESRFEEGVVVMYACEFAVGTYASGCSTAAAAAAGAGATAAGFAAAADFAAEDGRFASFFATPFDFVDDDEGFTAAFTGFGPATHTTTTRTKIKRSVSRKIDHHRTLPCVYESARTFLLLIRSRGFHR